MIEFVWPMNLGEWLAFLTAAGTVLVGMIALFAPKMLMRLVAMGESSGNGVAVSEFRANPGGFFLGLGVAAIILNQPLVYFTLGLAFSGAVIGRLISFAVEQCFDGRVIILTLVEVLAAFFTLNALFGFIA